MRRHRTLVATVGVGLLLLVGLVVWHRRASAYIRPVADEDLEVRVWTDQGDGGIYERGDRIRVYFEASHDCYVTLYNMDTEGFVHVLFPYDYDGSHFVQGGVVYRLPDRGDGYDLVVDGPKGMGYIQVVASVHPYPVPRWPRYWDPHYRWRNRFGGMEIRYIERISGDPFEAMFYIVGTLLPVGYEHLVTTDYTFFYVQEEVLYPRYLWYEGYAGPSVYWSIHWRPFDPYRRVCVVYEVQVYDDGQHVRRVRRYAPRVVRPVVLVERYREKRWYVRRRPVYRADVEKGAGYPSVVSTRDETSRSWYTYGEPMERRHREPSGAVHREKGEDVGYRRERSAHAPVWIERGGTSDDHRVERRKEEKEEGDQRLQGDEQRTETRTGSDRSAQRVRSKDRNRRETSKAERSQKASRENSEDDRVERRKRR